MSRREFLVSAAGLVAAPMATEAQPGRVPRIGLLLPTTAAEFIPQLKFFRQALSEAGYVEGRTILLELRWAEDSADRFPELAGELVRLPVDVIVAWSSPAALAAKRATSTIPIVMATTGDAVSLGLVASLARPGGNVTGNSILLPELAAKRMDILKEALPRVGRVAALSNPANPLHTTMLNAIKSTAQSLGVQLVPVEARAAAELAGALSAATSGGAGALMVLDDGLVLLPLRARIAELALKSRLPAIGGYRVEAQAGYLLAYGGAEAAYTARQTVVFVDRILRGARPADLPVEQPGKFELFVNLKTAKALGLTIPQSVLMRADRVLE